jgi:ABC-type Fe3+ transport system substrate-binding protein
MMSPGASQILGGGGSMAGGRMKKGNKELLDEYNLSTFAEEANGKEDAVGDFGDDKKAFVVRAVNGRNVPGENIDGDIKDLGSSTWFGRSKRGSTAGIVGSGSASKREKKVAIRDGDAESQRSLQSRRSRESLDHEISDGMGIMVSTSVFVTREKVGK